MNFLDLEYKIQNRPYSDNELKYNQSELYQKLNIGNKWCFHDKCGHIYKVKKNSKKEKEIITTDKMDVGNCSVCWKVNKTPNNYKDKALDVIKEFNEIFFHNNETLDYDSIFIERIFYNWLYNI